jgi:hypothetical protein
MQLDLSTPALLFPAISLLLLAYTNRFLSLGALIRSLHKEYINKPRKPIIKQIQNLKKRVILIRWMQAFGVLSLLICVLCMFAIFEGWILLSIWLFGISLILMATSLAFSIWEVQISVGALDILLDDMEAI